MTLFQIWNYFIGDFAPNPDQFKKELSELVRTARIIYKNNLYSLEKVDYTKVEKKKRTAEKLLTQANQISRYLKQIPWIEMVALTGSVSAFNAEEHSDIDILIVTKPDRLFLSRFFLVAILKLIGVYWSPQKPAGTICPNILLSSDALAWNIKDRNIYIANEISLLYPLFYRHNCYFDFLKQNGWVNNYLPNLCIPHTKPLIEKSGGSGKLIGFIEFVAMKTQTNYMKNKKTTETVTRNFIHFNIHDSAPAIIQKFHGS